MIVRRAAALGDFVTYAGVGLVIILAMRKAAAPKSVLALQDRLR